MKVVVTQVLSRSTELEPYLGAAALDAGDELDVGRELGGGGFGTVHRVDAVAGSRAPGVVVKRYASSQLARPSDNAAVLHALHRAVAGRWSSTPDDPKRQLGAVPYWVGCARWGADLVTISLARDLTVEGYVPFESILSDVGQLRGWLGLDLADRLAAAHAFAAGHAAAEAIGCIHADVNVENVFVDPTGGRAVTIDWDSGTVPGAPNHPVPLTPGKLDDFLSPEAKATGQLIPSNINELTERWAVGCMVHYLLFGVGPLFFLATFSERSVDEYLRSNTWPDIDRNSPLIHAPNWNFYTRYLQVLAELPDGVVDLFREFVTVGARTPSSRPTAAAWRDALTAVAQPPAFDWVVVSGHATGAGRPVRVSWSAPGATTVIVDGDGPFPAAGWTNVALDTSRSIRVLAVNPFGTTLHETPVVAVLAAPAPLNFALPRTGFALPSPPTLRVPPPNLAPLRGGVHLPPPRITLPGAPRRTAAPGFREVEPPRWPPPRP